MVCRRFAKILFVTANIQYYFIGLWANTLLLQPALLINETNKTSQSDYLLRIIKINYSEVEPNSAFSLFRCDSSTWTRSQCWLLCRLCVYLDINREKNMLWSYYWYWWHFRARRVQMQFIIHNSAYKHKYKMYQIYVMLCSGHVMCQI